MQNKILEFLKSIALPEVQETVASVCKVDVQFLENKAQINLVFHWPMQDIKNIFEKEIHEKLVKAFPEFIFSLNLQQRITMQAVQSGVPTLKNIKNIIVIASGKGGVGKSTTTVNLALALQQLGASVGILDADIYGPNQPHMLGMTEPPQRKEGHFVPVEKYGLYSMSIGYLIDANQPMVWRGPMVSKALQQLLFETNWPSLDYLLIDMPPGTGDIQLTLAQKIPVSGAVVVTTPQDIALLDARKGLEMFRKVGVNLLGIIENMSVHICSQCGHQEAVFGEQGADTLAAACAVPLLGRLPLDIAIRQDVDEGCPTVQKSPQSAISTRYRELARTIALILSQQKRDYTHLFAPKH